MYQTERTSPVSWTTTSNAPLLGDTKEPDALEDAQKLADLLKTPDLSDENIDLINGLITSALASLVDCGCDGDGVDFTGKSIEEMIEIFGD